MTITKLFGATTLATMLAFNVGYAAAQDPIDPGEETGIIVITGAGDPTALQSLLGGQGWPPGAEKGIVIINGTGDPTAVERLLGGQPLAPGAEKGIIIVNGTGDPTAVESLLGGQAPGAEKGIIIIESKGGPTALQSRLGNLPPGSEKGIIIIQNKPGGQASGVEKGIIIVGGKPGGQAVGSEAMGIVIENKPAGQGVAPGSEKGIIIIENLPTPGAESAIDKALLGESLGLSAGLPTLPTATQGGVALRGGGNVMQQLGDDGQRPAGVGTSGKALLPAVRIVPSAAAGRSLQAAPAIQAIMPSSIKPTQGIQGQKVAPITKSLQAVQ